MRARARRLFRSCGGALRPNWFIALPVPAAPWFARVGAPPRGIRRFHPDDLHFTVAFLGGVDERAARAAWATLAPPPRFPIGLGAVVKMGSPRRYSALSALVGEGREPLEAWIGEVRDGLLAAAGAPPDRHGVKAHCTVARPMRRASDAERAAGLDWAAGVDLSGVRVVLDRVALYTWSDDRKARLFRVAAELPAR